MCDESKSDGTVEDKASTDDGVRLSGTSKNERKMKLRNSLLTSTSPLKNLPAVQWASFVPAILVPSDG